MRTDNRHARGHQPRSRSVSGVASADPIADFYKGKSINWILSAGAGGGYATYAHAFAPFLTKHLPGNPQHRDPEHARRRRHPRDALPQQRRAQGRHHHRARAFERAVRAALRHPRREFRSAPDALGRQHHLGLRYLRVLGRVRHHQVGAHVRAGVHRRRHRRGLADGNHADHAQAVVRRQGAGHLRLQGRQRRLHRDGARRGARPLRRARVVDQVDAAGLVPEEDDRGADPDRARSATTSSRTSRRSIEFVKDERPGRSSN